MRNWYQNKRERERGKETASKKYEKTYFFHKSTYLFIPYIGKKNIPWQIQFSVSAKSSRPTKRHQPKKEHQITSNKYKSTWGKSLCKYVEFIIIIFFLFLRKSDAICPTHSQKREKPKQNEKKMWCDEFDTTYLIVRQVFGGAALPHRCISTPLLCVAVHFACVAARSGSSERYRIHTFIQPPYASCLIIYTQRICRKLEVYSIFVSSSRIAAQRAFSLVI